MRWVAPIVAILGALAAAGWGYVRLRPQRLNLEPRVRTPVVEFDGRRAAVRIPGGAAVAVAALFDDELYAYFNFDYLRTRRAAQGMEVLLTSRERGGRREYAVILHPGDDLLTALPALESLRRQGYIPGYELKFVPRAALQDYRSQTRVFLTAYNLPVRRRLERLSRAERLEIVKRFVLFKSRTDPRVRKGLAPQPPTLTDEQAERLAGDILTVADFFWLPLDVFLGIGAMENNYMDVEGDLQHAVWKRRAEPGDIVLRRRGGRVLVRNTAQGVWQITRETLRYAHKLYLKSDWDFSALPEHLRPPRKLDFERLTAGQLTTYAGLLFRDLLDRFGGDVARAVGAYNGGPGNPNMRYEAGVRMVANYARRLVERAARLDGRPAAEMQFLMPARQ